MPYSYQVGQTGKTVRPIGYVAAGLRCDAGHMVGVEGLEEHHRVNKDKEAPIFGVADLGIVGDVRQGAPAAARSPRRPT